MRIFLQSFVQAGYLLLVPGYFFYHQSVAHSLIPPILGGYFTAVSIALIAPLFFLYARGTAKRKVQITRIDVAFFSFMIFHAVILAYNYSQGRSQTIIQTQASVAPQFLAFFLIFRLLQTTDSSLLKINLFSFLIASILLLSNISPNQAIAGGYEADIDGDKLATYQGYALVYLIITILILPQIRLNSLRQAISIFAIFCLFVNGARTEFAGLILFTIAYETVIARQIRVFLALIGVSFAAYTYGPALLDEYLPQSRVSSLLTEGSEDGSASERMIVLESGLRTIAESPIFGSFGSYNQGEYIHNGLSAWVDLGLLGFLLYSALLLCPFCIIFSKIKKLGFNEAAFRLLLPSIVLLFAITSKHFTYPLLPIMLGLFHARRPTSL